MKNLIMADLRILGNRMWRIPLGFTVGCYVLSLLTGFSDRDYTSLVYFINLFLVPVLMLYELLKEEQKNKSEMMILTMPVNKSRFVYARFVVAILFIFLGVISLAGTMSLKSLTSENVMFQLYQEPKEWLFYFSGFSFIIFLMISLYYYTGKLYLSILSATLGLFTTLALILWLEESVLLPANLSWMTEFDLFLYPLRLVYFFGILVILHYMLRRYFKKITERSFLNGWFFILSVVSLMYIIRLLHIVFWEYQVIANAQEKILQNDGSYTPEMVLNWTEYIKNFSMFLPVYSISTAILVFAWIAVFIKNKDIIMKSYILISLVPSVSMTFTYLTYLFFESFLKIDVQYGDDTYYLSTIAQILFIPLCFFGFAKLTTFILNSKKSY